MLYPVLNMDAMTAHRKRRLAELIQRRFDGAQVAFARAVGLSEGRVAQLVNADESFGERSAKGIVERLGLEERFFEKGFPANEDYSQISRLTVVAGAGSGRPVYSEDIIDGLAFRKEFLREAGILKPDDGVVIGVRGLSMGELLDGSVVLVNKKRREPKRDKYFVFWRQDEGVVLKRVVKQGQVWVAHSDNDDKTMYPDFPFEDGQTLIGQAVWAGVKL